MAGTKILPKCSMTQCPDSGSTFYSPWTGNWYVGGIGSDGVAYLAKYTSNYKLAQLANLGSFPVDEHCTPYVLELRPDGSNPGKVLVGMSKHVDTSYGMITSSAGDIREWDAQYQIEASTPGSTFCFLYQANDTAKTIFCLYTQANQRWGYRTSTTGASGSWSSYTTFYDSGTISVQPIIRPAQDPDNPNIIHMFISEGTIGAFRHFYMEIQSDASVKFYKSDGTDITSTKGSYWSNASNFTPVAGDSTANTFSVNIYNGKPACIYTQNSTLGSDPYGIVTNYLAKWTGSAWTTETISGASANAIGEGAYQGPGYRYYNYNWSNAGIWLNPNNIDEVYESIAFNGSWTGSPPTAGSLTDARIQKWVKSGGTWAKSSDITGSTGNVNYLQNGLQRGSARFFFSRGTQSFWTNWSMDSYTYPDLSLNTTKNSTPTWNASVAPKYTTAYYLLYEGTGGNGATLHDVTGSYNGSIVRASGLTWATGTYGPELNGFSTSDYVLINSLGSAFSSNAYPKWVAAMFKTTDSTNQGILVGMARSSDTNPIFQMRVNSSSNSNYVGVFYRADDGTEETLQVATGIQSRATMSDGNYHVIQWTAQSGSNRRLYYDGVLATSSAANWSAKNITFDRGSLGVFYRSSAAAPHPGTLAAVVIGWGGPSTNANADTHAAQVAWDLMSGQFGGTWQRTSAGSAAPLVILSGKAC